MERIKKHWAGTVFLFSYFLLVAYKLIFQSAPFFDWDESIYAQVGREMIRNKSFLVPLWQGTPWLDKPPVPSLVYGIIQLIPISPEISTRIATLVLSCIALVLLYKLSYKITSSRMVAFTTILITAFLPGFAQRGQALNVDVFLLIGWLGYVLYKQNVFVSSLFMLLGVLSKSILGLYPPLLFAVYYSYELIMKRVKKEEWVKEMQIILFQIFISSLWFLGMTLQYKGQFIKLQFYESHFKRVAFSIEQHFGQRTFYIDTLVEQMKYLVIPAIFSLITLTIAFFKNKKNGTIFLSLFFVPWFLFLNITKTKIAWYLYPVLPQFAFLASYPFAFFKKKIVPTFIYFFSIATVFFVTISPLPNFILSSYATFDDHYRIALDAHNNNCSSLYVLVGSETRSSYAVLKGMNLTITTTTWWGNHPSIAYYANTKTGYDYTISSFDFHITQAKIGNCFIFEKKDEVAINTPPGLKKIGTKNNQYVLMMK